MWHMCTNIVTKSLAFYYFSFCCNALALSEIIVRQFKGGASIYLQKLFTAIEQIRIITLAINLKKKIQPCINLLITFFPNQSRFYATLCGIRILFFYEHPHELLIFVFTTNYLIINLLLYLVCGLRKNSISFSLF